MKHLKYIAEGKGFTLDSLQEKTGIDRNFLEMYWNNQAIAVNIAILEKLADVLDVDIDSLVRKNPHNLMSDKFVG